MYLFWLSIVLFSIAWSPLIGIYSSTTIHHATPYWFIWASLLTGIVVNIFALRSVSLEKFDKKYYLFFVPLCFSIYVIPFPYNIAFILLTLGLIISLFIRWANLFKVISIGLVYSGMVLAAQTIIIPFFFLIFSRYHRVDWMTPIILIMNKLIGLESTMIQNELVVRDLDKVYSFIISWDLLALYPLLNIFVGGVLAILMFSNKKNSITAYSNLSQQIKKVGILAIILFCYMIFRCVGIMLSFLNLNNVTVFWRLDIMALSLLPLIFLLAKFIRFDSIDCVSLPALKWSRRDLLATCLVIICVVSITVFFGFHDPGIPKQGRILIDEGHSDWEWTTRKFDTEWYGQQSTYNYYCLAEYLKCFYQVAQKTENLTEDLLKDYDILILKTPTEPFSSNEIEAIKLFVKNGGGCS